jgi:hypothetical protein
MNLDLGAWLPDPQVRTRHRRSVEADADRLWRAAETVRLRDAPTLGRAVRWRIPGTSSDLSFRDLLRQYPFAVIAEGTRWSISGMCGRIWTIRRDHPRIGGADDFLSWEGPLRGTAALRSTRWLEGSWGDVGGEVPVQLVGVGATHGRLVFVKPLAEHDPSQWGVV